MKEHWSLKGQNRGASLIAVMATIAFVSMIGIVISQITITNIQMKQVEQQGKTNFYDAEKVLDDLAAGLNLKAASAMQKAYTDMLSQYRTVTEAGGDAQAVFRRLYMNNLIEVFQDTASMNPPKKVMSGVEADAEVNYELGEYSIDIVQNSFTTKDPEDENKFLYGDCLKIETGTNQYRADYKAGTFVLEKIRISVQDPQMGYITDLSTDIVLNTPELNFDNNNLVKDYMRYSLIGDTEINLNASNVIVDGNVYAGEEGINVQDNSQGSRFNGSLIVTRGDIVSKANSGSSLILGSDDGQSRIFAENVKIDKGSTGVALTLKGSSYISDDLEVNGKNSTVNLAGEYLGYNFNRDYPSSGAATETGSEFSSAIVINGHESTVNMLDLKYLHLAGRTYIERDSADRDVRLGESVSVRSNQLAYYVPDSFLNASFDRFADDTGASFAAYMKVGDMSNYVNLSDPVTEYRSIYPLGGGENILHYLKFSSDEAANKFYADFYTNNKDTMNGYAKNYLSETALILSGDMYYTLSGNMLYQESAGVPNEKNVVISNADLQKGGTFYNYAGSIGVTYKSLQMYLEERHKGITSDDIRIENGEGEIDKTANRLFDYLIQFRDIDGSLLTGKAAVQKLLAKHGVVEKTFPGPEDNIKVVVADSDYEVTNDKIQGGLIIATGDVHVRCGSGDSGFSGLILCGGKIILDTDNAHVTANEALVSQLLSDDAEAADGKPKFAYLFNGYCDTVESSMGEVAVERYMTYDNWTKTIE